MPRARGESRKAAYLEGPPLTPSGSACHFEGLYSRSEHDTEPIFAITRHHGASCGQPPRIDDAMPNQYCGYFENEHAEQAIFVYDRAKHRGLLYIVDAGWEHPHAVANGSAPDLSGGGFVGGLARSGAPRPGESPLLDAA